MLAAARALWFLANEKKFIISFTHKPGIELILADSLSRESLGLGHKKIADREIKSKGLSRFYPDFKHFNYEPFL